jgi:hypothetical protein
MPVAQPQVGTTGTSGPRSGAAVPQFRVVPRVPGALPASTIGGPATPFAPRSESLVNHEGQ